ncbi:MAG: helix-turn-helix domain-containing protein [Deltaproteobacteria bacterium]|nr:helix-turn-helix domain-containing protein [Deltaproteobacteria bacterium]
MSKLESRDNVLASHLTTKQVARLLGVSELTVLNYERAGKLAAIKIGCRGERFFLKLEIKRFLDDREAAAGAAEAFGLTAKAAAERLGVSLQSIWLYERAGKLHAKRFGGGRRFPREEVDRLFVERLAKKAPKAARIAGREKRQP